MIYSRKSYKIDNNKITKITEIATEGLLHTIQM
jgi:hypothetical protein